jgi:transcriptional regulator with XRE-family HTH domain
MMMVNSLEIRAKKLGVLIREARLNAEKEIAECAQAMGISPETFAAYENGSQAPSLPELETLAFFLNIPTEYFWERATLSTGQVERPALESIGSLLPLRHRIISVLLRKSRLEADISLEELSRYVEISPDQLKRYESGEQPVPLPALEVISVALNLSIREFQDQSGPIGRWAMQRKAIEGFLELPPEMQQFVSKPVNLPYLELAQRLSEMSVDRLRNVAEGLLEITL